MDELRESLEYWEGLMHVDSMPEGKFEPKPLAPIVAAARRSLALTETGPGPRLIDAVDAICEVEFGEDVEEEMWDELLDAGIEVRAALADYLTEEETK